MMAYREATPFLRLLDRAGLIKRTDEFSRCAKCGKQITEQENSVTISFKEPVWTWTRFLGVRFSRRLRTETYCKADGLEKFGESLKCPIWIEVPVLADPGRTAINYEADVVHPTK